MYIKKKTIFIKIIILNFYFLFHDLTNFFNHFFFIIIYLPFVYNHFVYIFSLIYRIN